ncbi:MAG TPA: tetratricopeptide repeat protein [Methylomirabilota bacterium]|nr:tetratricopeptide repeat protein [Methylomirabilota bacterium]
MRPDAGVEDRATPSGPAPASSRGGGLVLPAVIAAAIATAFWPSLWSSFVWDDEAFFIQNPHYRGLGWSQLRWMFSSDLLGHYSPLSWLTHGLEYLVWGLNPFGYHLTNLALHVVNALLFLGIARRLLGRATTLTGPALGAGAGVAALFFALHPLRVESVAWISERRGVLSATLFLVTVGLYLQAADSHGRPRRRFLVASLLAYALGGIAKSMVMSLPAVLVLLDLYPLRRLPANPRRWLAPAVRPLWREKLPYLAIGVAAGAIAYTARSANIRMLAPDAWLAKVVYTLWLPVQKTLIPVGLSPLYELPLRLDPREPRFLVAALGILGVTALALALARAWPAGLAVWVYQGLVLAPVASFTHAGVQLTADRYTYLATLGSALLVGAGGGMVVRAGRAAGAVRRQAHLGLALLAAWLIGLGVLTWHQTRIWRDTGTLWSHALTITPDCAICLNNLGTWHLNRGDARSALPRLSALAAVRPTTPMVFGRLGHAYYQLGHLPEAIAAYRAELARLPEAVPLRLWLANALLQSHRPAEAVAQYRQVIDAWPREPNARAGLAQAHLLLGESGQAREQYDVLRTLDPELAARLRGAFEPEGR